MWAWLAVSWFDNKTILGCLGRAPGVEEGSR